MNIYFINNFYIWNNEYIQIINIISLIIDIIKNIFRNEKIKNVIKINEYLIKIYIK